jgi:hypothetical protein
MAVEDPDVSREREPLQLLIRALVPMMKRKTKFMIN